MATYKCQHVAFYNDVEVILEDGFTVRDPRNAFAQVFGPGVYFGVLGDKQSEWFYANNGHNRSPRASKVIEAVVSLENPLVIKGGDGFEVRKAAIDAFGSKAHTAHALRRARAEIMERFTWRTDWEDAFKLKWVRKAYESQYNEFDFEEMLGYAARAIGHDGIVVDQLGEFCSNVGGSQVVVFHPTKDNIRITKVRPVRSPGEWA